MKEKLIDNAVLAETKLTELKGRLIQLTNTLGQTDLGTFAYGYDNPLLSQRTSMTSGLGTTNYSYDSNYQLTGATYPNATPFNGEVHAWTYDNIGNRLTNTVNASTANSTYFKNGSNPLNGQRLQSDGTKTYTYDANGNVTGDGTYTYTWDYENRLTGITGGGLTASYSYDYEGRRKSKTVGGVTTNYLYHGENLIREMSTTTADYLFGPGIDQPLAQSRAGAISYYVVEGLGSTTALSDPAGAPQNNYNYDAWGVVRNQTGSTPNSFAYTSREFAETGLYFYRARYYNPSVARFTSEDRYRFKAGINFYRYVFNAPLLNIDPLGLESATASGGGAILVGTCCSGNTYDLGGAAARVCLETNRGRCKQMLEIYKRHKCFQDLCKKTIKIKCEAQPINLRDACGTTEGGDTVILFPRAFPRCGSSGDSPMATIAHEMAHLCGSPDDYFFGWIRSWEAYQIGAACDKDRDI